MADYKEYLNTLPEHMQDAMLRYIENGIPPGSFLEAVLCNDLKGAFSRADHINLRHMQQYAEFMYWYMPSPAQGSVENFEHWCKVGGLQGKVSAE